MTINGSSERDYESMWRALYERIGKRCNEVLERVEVENDNVKLRALAARFYQLREIQRLMERMGK